MNTHVTEYLRTSDLRNILEFAERLQACDTRETFSAEFEAGVSSVVGCDTCCFSEIDPAGRHIGSLASRWQPTREEWAVFRALVSSHPMVQHYLRTADRRVLSLSDFWTQRAFRDTALYSELFRDRGTRYQLMAPLRQSQSGQAVLVFSRSQRDFGQRERAAVDTLRLYVARAERLVATQIRINRVLEHLDHLGEASQYGLLLLDSAGSIEFATGQVRSALGRYFRRQDSTRMPEELADWVARRSNDPLTMARKHGVLTIWLRRGKTGLPDALLFRERSYPEGSPPPLTRREREVLVLLAAGLPNKRIARQLGISIPTVKTYTNGIYRKLRVSSRTEAIAEAVRRGIVEL